MSLRICLEKTQTTKTPQNQTSHSMKEEKGVLWEDNSEDEQ